MTNRNRLPREVELAIIKVALSDSGVKFTPSELSEIEAILSKPLIHKPIPTSGLLGTMVVNFDVDLDVYCDTKSKKTSNGTPLALTEVGVKAIEAAIKACEEERKKQ